MQGGLSYLVGSREGGESESQEDDPEGLRTEQGEAGDT